MKAEFRIEFEHEEDGRWIAEVVELPGVLAYGLTKEAAQTKVETLSQEVVASQRSQFSRQVSPVKRRSTRIVFMEANEAQELQEQAEKGGESAMRPVAFTMAVLAVLVAITTVLGHRTHTEAILTQNQATDQWNFYQAHKIRSNDTELAADLLGVLTIADQHAADKLAKSYADHQTKWTADLKDAQDKAEGLEGKVESAEARANRFDLAEALLEIGLVITSVTLLTRSRIYWYLGLAFSLAGIASVASGFFLK